MAQHEFTIIVKIWDTWDKDTYTTKGYSVYTIMEIGNILYFMERNLNAL